MRYLRFVLFAVVGVFAARLADAQCEPDGAPGNLLAAHTSGLYLAIPGMPAVNFETNWDIGRVTQLGKIEVDKELVFKIAVRRIGDVFYSGVASRNSDGVPPRGRRLSPR